MNYEYKTVPIVAQLSSKTTVSVSEQVEDFINDYAQEGWELESISDVNVEIKPGCLASLLGANIRYRRHDIIVFKRKVEDLV